MGSDLLWVPLVGGLAEEVLWRPASIGRKCSGETCSASRTCAPEVMATSAVAVAGGCTERAEDGEGTNGEGVSSLSRTLSLKVVGGAGREGKRETGPTD